jgi:hypothetical protein
MGILVMLERVIFEGGIREEASLYCTVYMAQTHPF